MSVSQDTREALVSPQGNFSLLTFVEISSDELTAPLYFVQNNVDVVSEALGTSETYVAASFSVNLPSQEDSTAQETSLTISGVDRKVIKAIRSIKIAPDVRMFIAMGQSPDSIERGPLEFKLRAVSFNVTSVSGTLMYENILRNNISLLSVTSQNFPGMF